MASPTLVVGYLALFAAVGFLFLFVNLLVGYFLRPSDPHAEKLEIYECGEPTIGSSFVQFDLRFYVVALVFIVFDVEVAFLFPLATVQGKVAQLADPGFAVVQPADAEGNGGGQLTQNAFLLEQELGVANPAAPEGGAEALQADARRLGWMTFAAINVFFVVLLIGFAYEWKTGAFDWVRAVSKERALRVPRAPVEILIEEQPALTV
jgi:NADH-quinone oxidoreductase subunit A